MAVVYIRNCARVAHIVKRLEARAPSFCIHSVAKMIGLNLLSPKLCLWFSLPWSLFPRCRIYLTFYLICWSSHWTCLTLQTIPARLSFLSVAEEGVLSHAVSWCCLPVNAKAGDRSNSCVTLNSMLLLWTAVSRWFWLNLHIVFLGLKVP